ncbi:MAG: tetraacyldisaccharide 4'-kinase [Pyrinomonadaceae bacterium]
MSAAASLLLTPISAIYGAVTRIRLAAYQRGILSVSKLPATVVSVGNLTIGGTGKTPLVDWICHALSRARGQENGREPEKLCVLTRGYGRDNPKTHLVVSDGNEILAGEEESGDEPFLLARNLLGVAAVIANPNRLAAGRWAIETWNTDVFVLDDGLQHLQLARDLNIVSLDATNPWGNGGLLPYGRLREPVEGLSRADCIVITRTEQVEDVTPIKDSIKRLVGTIPVFSSRMLVSEVRGIVGNPVDRESLLRGTLGAFCGIGSPEPFFNNLRSEGYKLAFTESFPDHHRYTQAELDLLSLKAKARGATSLITTEKDAVKLTNLNFPVPCCYLKIMISIDDSDQLLGIIHETISKRKI